MAQTDGDGSPPPLRRASALGRCCEKRYNRLGRGFLQCPVNVSVGSTAGRFMLQQMAAVAELAAGSSAGPMRKNMATSAATDSDHNARGHRR